MNEIEALVAFEGRAAGTDAERRAAEHLARRLRALGRDAHVEPIRVRPRAALTHLIHAVAAVVGSVVAVGSPAIGAALLGLTGLSLLGDLTGTLHLTRRLTSTRASQNVLSREDGGGAGRLVLVAHYDVARGGLLFDPGFARRRAALARRLRLPIGVGGGFLIAVVGVLACALLRVLGVDSALVSLVQFVPTALLVAAVAVLADTQLARPVPGAADNAAGVATVLRLAERHGGHLDHLDLWVLLTGAEEPQALGMSAWLRAHRRELARERTVFLNVDKVGHGTVRYATREGLALPAAHDRRLVALCDELAAADERGRYGARRSVSTGTSDASAARSRGYAAITISSLGALDRLPNQHQQGDASDRIDPDALDRTLEFCSDLVELIDERIGAEIDGRAHSAGRPADGD